MWAYWVRYLSGTWSGEWTLWKATYRKNGLLSPALVSTTTSYHDNADYHRHKHTAKDFSIGSYARFCRNRKKHLRFQFGIDCHRSIIQSKYGTPVSSLLLVILWQINTESFTQPILFCQGLQCLWRCAPVWWCLFRRSLCRERFSLFKQANKLFVDQAIY